MQDDLRLSVSLRTSGPTAELKQGKVPTPGVVLDYVEVKPHVLAFRRMVRNLEFDVCELASTTYMVARAHGARFKALPIFFNRRFHHNGLVVRPDAGITVPKDLEGKRVGVRAYSVTGGVWTRGVLQNEYGVDPAKVTWIVDDEEHVAQLQLPPNVQHAPEGKSLAGMMAAGEIDAGFLANAGIGRAGPPSESWETPAAEATQYRELIADPDQAAADWFARVGALPTHGTVVIRDDIVSANPDLPRILFDAMVESKARYLQRLNNGEAPEADDLKLLKLMKIVGPDPIPYGLKDNRKSIETLMTYAVQQGLMTAPLDIAEMFYDLEP